MPQSINYERKRKFLSFAMTVPALVFLAVFFVYPVLDFVWLSFFPEDGSFTLEYYQRIADPELPYIRVLIETFWISIATTIACIALGYPYAYAIHKSKSVWVKTLLLGLVLLPFWTSLLVRTIAFMQLLQNRGMVNEVLISMGLIDEPIRMVRNQLGVIIGMVYMLLPYFLLPLHGVMDRIDRRLEPSARSLGASRLRAFASTVLPLSLPGVTVGASLVFLLSLGYFITPALLGGGKVQMISMLIEDQISPALNYPFAAALSVVLIVATAVFGLATWGVAKLLERVTGQGAV